MEYFRKVAIALWVMAKRESVSRSTSESGFISFAESGFISSPIFDQKVKLTCPNNYS